MEAALREQVGSGPRRLSREDQLLLITAMQDQIVSMFTNNDGLAPDLEVRMDETPGVGGSVHWQLVEQPEETEFEPL